jgi:hypothetical protein
MSREESIARHQELIAQWQASRDAHSAMVQEHEMRTQMMRCAVDLYAQRIASLIACAAHGLGAEK